MLFHSYHFLLFFPAFCLVFWNLPANLRLLWLLLGSCYFYVQLVPVYLAVLFLVIGIDYLSGRWMDRFSGRWRQLALLFSLAANLSLLAFFKYWDLLGQTLSWLFPVWPIFGLALPIGLSFHTFQSLSYSLEVYRRSFASESSLARLSAYVLFFPQLVAGPIERPAHLLPQLRNLSGFQAQRLVPGLAWMCRGYCKKVFVADSLGRLVDGIYHQPQQHLGPALALASLYFAFQLYFDFSGYSDIARGCAHLLGVELVANFQRPFLAESPREFWRRWHISLSQWFRDYVYLPLKPQGTVLAALITFLLSGLWHGAHWKFALWGLFHGLWVGVQPLLPRAICSGWVGRSLVLLTFWISMPLFRARSLEDALYILANFLTPGPSHLPGWPLAVIAGLYLWEWLAEKDRLPRAPLVLEMASVYLVIILAAITFSELTHSQGPPPFLYFQF